MLYFVLFAFVLIFLREYPIGVLIFLLLFARCSQSPYLTTPRHKPPHQTPGTTVATLSTPSPCTSPRRRPFRLRRPFFPISPITMTTPPMEIGTVCRLLTKWTTYSTSVAIHHRYGTGACLGHLDLGHPAFFKSHNNDNSNNGNRNGVSPFEGMDDLFDFSVNSSQV